MSIPHIIIIVVCRLFVLQRPHYPFSMSLSLSSVGHLSCGGLVLIIIWWAPSSIPTLSLSLLSAGHLFCRGLVTVVVWWGPRCPQAFCPVEALSSSLFDGASLSVPHTIVIVIGFPWPFVLQRPCHPFPTDRPLLLLSLLSSMGLSSCGGLI